MPISLRADPELAAKLDVPAETREKVRKRFGELLTENREAEDRGPSLLRYVRWRLFGDSGGADVRAKRQRTGWPFPGVYQKGHEFGWSRELQTKYGDGWLPRYFAFLYFRAHRRVTDSARLLWMIARTSLMGGR